ncbi:transforming growth factor beta receptor type 3 [Amia ocellicauda]|uniref:transforming growth factor beta receptor type 3 n=1 Tax=Amia ocellicauda TaxID=2972642 RepID=UPI003464BCA7|nr:TGBR3 factor [Amia calva]
MAALRGLAVLLLLMGAGTAVELQCRVTPVGALFPVQAQLERFGVGPGCAARGLGDRETHVISVGRATPSPDNQVSVFLRPLSLSQPHGCPLALVLHSQHAVHWRLEVERVLPGTPLLIQLPQGSSVDSVSVGASVRVESVGGLPSRPSALLRWALAHHPSVASFLHAPRANRVYIRLGEDPMMPSTCVLQPLFLSHNYLTSDLQPQEVRGCTTPGQGHDPEVHVILLQSAGGGQVQVPVEAEVCVLGGARGTGVVLILHSKAPVSWAITHRGFRGHITTISSSRVSARWPTDPSVTLTSTLALDLFTTYDLLGWTRERGFPSVTSYTEARLANRFVVQLEGGRDMSSVPPQSSSDVGVVRPRAGGVPGWLQQWVGRGSGSQAVGASAALSVQCGGGLLSVSVASDAVQPVSAVTLSDPSCRALANGSHFLVEAPVISCGTEAEFQQSPRGVLYRNTVLLWRPASPVAMDNSTQEALEDGETPAAMQFSCLAPAPPRSTVPPAGQEARRAGALFSLELYSTQAFLPRDSGPCVVAANSRVFVEVSVLGWDGGVGVQSCVVSPHSDPRAAPVWTLIQRDCPHDPSLTFYSPEGEGMNEGVRGEEWRGTGRGTRGESERRGHRGEREEERGSGGKGEGEGEGQVPRQRFSFVLRPVFNNSVQFVHCNLMQCRGPRGPAWGPRAEERRGYGRGPHPGATLPQCVSLDDVCTGRLAPTSSLSHHPQFTRTLSRPLLVTQPAGGGHVLTNTAGQEFVTPHMRALSKSRLPVTMSAGLDTAAVLSVVFTAFLIGAGLMGALWCIYYRTGLSSRQRRKHFLDPTDRTTAAPLNPPALVEQSSSSV